MLHREPPKHLNRLSSWLPSPVLQGSKANHSIPICLYTPQRDKFSSVGRCNPNLLPGTPQCVLIRRARLKAARMRQVWSWCGDTGLPRKVLFMQSLHFTESKYNCNVSPWPSTNQLATELNAGSSRSSSSGRSHGTGKHRPSARGEFTRNQSPTCSTDRTRPHSGGEAQLWDCWQAARAETALLRWPQRPPCILVSQTHLSQVTL